MTQAVTGTQVRCCKLGTMDSEQRPARRRGEPNWALLTPLIWGPVLPLSRQVMNATKASPSYRMKIYMGLVGLGTAPHPNNCCSLCVPLSSFYRLQHLHTAHMSCGAYRKFEGRFSFLFCKAIPQHETAEHNQAVLRSLSNSLTYSKISKS